MTNAVWDTDVSAKRGAGPELATPIVETGAKLPLTEAVAAPTGVPYDTATSKLALSIELGSVMMISQTAMPEPLAIGIWA
jgi:hypothetical protein